MQPPDILEGDRVIRTEMRKTGQTDFLLKSPHGCDMLTANKSIGWLAQSENGIKETSDTPRTSV